MRDLASERMTEAVLGVLMKHELVIEYDTKRTIEGSENVAVKYTIRRRDGKDPE